MEQYSVIEEICIWSGLLVINATVTKKAVSVRWECWLHTARVVRVGSGEISILSCGHIERSDRALFLDTSDNPYRAETSGGARWTDR